MVTPASLPRISGPIACLALLLSSLPASAQEAKKPASGKEQSEEAIFIPVEYRPPPYQVSVGVRIAGKAKVKFSGIGNIPYNSNPQNNITDNTVTRLYDNGYVGPDNSRDTEGNPIVKDDGKTNAWSYSSADQLSPPDFPNATTLTMQANRIENIGITATAETGATTAWDIEISRQLGGNKRFSWGLLFGAGISDINAKTSGTVKGNLRTITDTYSLGGEGGNTKLTTIVDGVVVYKPYSSPGPQFEGLYHLEQGKDATTGALLTNTDGTPYMVAVATVDANGVQLREVQDASVRLPGLPSLRTDVVTQGVDVTGVWQVKGSFLTARFGPYVAMQLGRRFAVRASAGITLTVLGAQYSFREEYLVPALAKYISIDTAETKNESTVAGTFGYFASGEFDWFMTNRTGLFLGASYENYSRNLRITMPDITTQFADIQTSTGTVIRTGITTRF